MSVRQSIMPPVSPCILPSVHPSGNTFHFCGQGEFTDCSLLGDWSICYSHEQQSHNLLWIQKNEIIARIPIHYQLIPPTKSQSHDLFNAYKLSCSIEISLAMYQVPHSSSCWSHHSCSQWLLNLIVNDSSIFCCECYRFLILTESTFLKCICFSGMSKVFQEGFHFLRQYSLFSRTWSIFRSCALIYMPKTFLVLGTFARPLM